MTDSSSSAFHRQLDARLRNVPIPPGLSERLRSIAEPTEQELDELARAVPIPAGLRERLGEAAADEVLDSRLRDVLVPRSLLGRLRVIPHLRPHRRIQRYAVAASLLLLIGGAYTGLLVGIAGAMRPAVLASSDVEYLELASASAEAVDESFPLLVLPFGAPPAEDQPGEAPWNVPPALTIDSPLPARTSPGPVREAMVAFRDGPGNWWTDVLLLRWGPLGAPQADEDENVPELESSPPMEPRGVELSAGTDAERLFRLRYGLHAPRVLGPPETAGQVTLPLTTERNSLERIRQLLSERRLAGPDQVRVEDFLAAMPYEFAAPQAGEVALRTAAGPHVFGDGTSGLLLLGVQATSRIRASSSATHLTIAVDLSDSMRFGNRIEQIRQALGGLLPELRPGDRLSLVAFQEEVVQEVEQASRQEEPALRKLLDGWRPAGGTNLSAGLQRAISIALEPSLSGRLSRQLVVITDSSAGLSEVHLSDLRHLLEVAASQGLECNFLALSEPRDGDPQLAELARAGAGEVWNAERSEEIRWRLLETVYGNSSVVADQVQLRLELNPGAVAAWRLVGHEANALATLQPAGSAVTLRAGQSAATLLEIWLRPGTEDLVGWAEIEWRPPSGGPARRQKQRLSRLQFAASFAEAPLSLQAAAIAAETAEVLRQRPRIERDAAGVFQLHPRPGGLQHVLARAEQIHSKLAEREGFAEFLAMVRQLDAVERGRAD
ncbi:MAG: VWA domain-containing protein [Pirellulaceae bacterium]|nr:VWA domain-containing protein [Pirellulaceae bacterium]